MSTPIRKALKAVSYTPRKASFQYSNLMVAIRDDCFLNRMDKKLP